MFKKMLIGSVAGASLLALVGAADAEVNVNIYGASAQYEFWNAAAAPFMINGLGCSNVERATNSAKNGITRGDCVLVAGQPAERVHIRYSSKASFDGISAILGVDPTNSDNCSTTGFTDAYRQMADEGNTTFAALPGNGTVNGTKCVDVTLGSSDVAAQTFRQSSIGNLNGHNGGGRVTRSSGSFWTSVQKEDLANPALYTPYQPVVVPFAFFAHTTTPVSNLSRMQAVALFSGRIGNWNEFDPDYASQGVSILMRHAGSGTHATLDAAVMRFDDNLVQTQPLVNNTNPVRWFYEGSSDMRNAINTLPGSIGYMDADASLSAHPNIKMLSLEGEMPTREGIAYGRYPFWSAQWLYEDRNEPTYATGHPVIQSLMDWASVAANLTTYVPTKAVYWATQGELQVTKLNDDQLPVHK
jgi:hypothetical protein